MCAFSKSEMEESQTSSLGIFSFTPRFCLWSVRQCFVVSSDLTLPSVHRSGVMNILWVIFESITEHFPKVGVLEQWWATGGLYKPLQEMNVEKLF